MFQSAYNLSHLLYYYLSHHVYICIFFLHAVPGTVKFFEAYPMGSSALLLMWKAPESPNGILTGYKVICTLNCTVLHLFLQAMSIEN